MAVSRKRRTRQEMAVLREQALDHWRTGKTISWIADTLSLSTKSVHDWVKGVKQDLVPLIKTQVDVNKQLLELNKNQRLLFNAEVDKRTRYIEFFNDLAVKNAEAAASKITEETTQVEHRLLAETILKSRETVFGKTPDMAVQVNTTVTGAGAGPLPTPEEYRRIAHELNEHV